MRGTPGFIEGVPVSMNGEYIGVYRSKSLESTITPQQSRCRCTTGSCSLFEHNEGPCIRYVIARRCCTPEITTEV